MSGPNWERNTEAMTAAAKRRAQEARRKVDGALASLLTTNRPLNFTSVANAAGVTKAYLYSKPDIRDRIETLRQQQGGAQAREPAPKGRTEASKVMLLAAKDRRIRELEAQVRQLKAELKVALGKLYERA